MSKHPLDWRNPRDVVPLENFDFKEAHIRSELDRSMIWSLTAPRMAGSPFAMNPEEIRDVLRSGEFRDHEKGYLLGVFKQLSILDAKLFRHSCGASLYELARAMIEVELKHPFVVEWLNCQTQNYQLSEADQRRWWSSDDLGSAR